jgi:NADPH-dependent ferric siderophore reductase
MEAATPWVTLVLGLAASPAIKAIVEAIRDRMVARGRVKSRADRILMWAWELLEHVHELRVMLIKRGVAEDDLPKIPPNPLEGQK